MQFLLNKHFLHLILVVLISNHSAYSQENTDTDTTTTHSKKTSKGFHAGFYLGSYWANRNTAYIYDGYGFDINGQKNDFANSLLRYQIVDVYGAANGGTDYIAQLLNVDHTEWFFTERDMPVNLRYNTTYQVGFNARYQLDKNASLLFHINGTKLSVTGKFTITTNGSSNGLQNQARINEFNIVGAEQRLSFQFGYQKILGKNERFKGLLEGGLNVILSKVQKNQAFLLADPNSGKNNAQNNISFDLMSLYSQPPYNYYTAKYFTGVGIGAFCGIGVHIAFNPKYTIQLVYNPSYDRIALGYNPTFKLQHSFGLRIYYNLS